MDSHILLQRDDESSSSLSPGAIAGIACGAGALFLTAVILFFIYWRRDRQFDRAENFYQTRHGLEDVIQPSSGGMMPTAVSYTMDYKMDGPQKECDGSSYTYSPDKPTWPFSPLSVSEGGASSAMPTHPAYIPRALVRGLSSSNHSRTTSVSTHQQQHQHLTNTISSSSHFPNSTNNNNPDDMLVQAYLDTASGERVPSAVLVAASSPPSRSSPFLPKQQQPQDATRSSSESSLDSGLPIQKPRAVVMGTLPAQILPAQILALPISLPSSQSPGYISSTSSSSAAPTPTRKPRRYIPPHLNLGPVDSAVPTNQVPSGTAGEALSLKGVETSTTTAAAAATSSGPLAFAEHYHLPLANPRTKKTTTTTTNKREHRRTLFAEDDDELSETDVDDQKIVSDSEDHDQQIISDSEDDEFYDERANRRRQQQDEEDRRKRGGGGEEEEDATAAAAAAAVAVTTMEGGRQQQQQQQRRNRQSRQQQKWLQQQQQQIQQHQQLLQLQQYQHQQEIQQYQQQQLQLQIQEQQQQQQHKRKKNNSNRNYAEIEMGRDSDIW